MDKRIHEQNRVVRPPKPNLMRYAESYLEDRWDEDRWGDPSREVFMAAVKDFAVWINGAVGDCFVDWSAEYTAARQSEEDEDLFIRDAAGAVRFASHVDGGPSE